MVRNIKRYNNRKLYDTEKGGYVTLNDIITMVRSGIEIKVKHHKTNVDCTDDVLRQSYCRLLYLNRDSINFETSIKEHHGK